MASYRVRRSYRNPEGVRVGQTWYAVSPINQPVDVIKITAVYGADYIYAQKNNGEEIRLSDKALIKHFSLENNNNLFGDA